MNKSILLTGATGLLGHALLIRLLAEDPVQQFIVLVRDPGRWARVARDLPAGEDRVTAITADLLADGLGMDRDAREQVCRKVGAILHLAADTTFSRPLAEARAANTRGTGRVLELAAECGRDVRFVYVSTAFAAGRRTGFIAENNADATGAWVNAYEQSKYEAEALVRQTAANWIVFRPSTVVCDSPAGRVSQFNAAHRALRLYRDGLVGMVPGVPASTLDAVTTDYVAGALARLAFRADLRGRTIHLCAGRGALPLAELLDITYDCWAADVPWRRRFLSRPLLTDLATYALFERTIEETADASLRRVTRILSHFVPQLALPKDFDTTTADTELGYRAPPVRDYWIAMVQHLMATHWWEPGDSSVRSESISHSVGRSSRSSGLNGVGPALATGPHGSFEKRPADQRQHYPELSLSGLART